MITIEKVKSRLEMLGYTATSSDDGLIAFIMTTTERSVQIMINVQSVPDALENIVIDKIVGEFLLNKKNTGQDVGIDVDMAIKAITEGDTNVQYETKYTPEAKMDMLIQWLINSKNGEILCFRRIAW
jgi:hypothetical protein